MDRQRLFHGVLATVGGLVLLESLFLPWYGLEVTVGGVAAGNSQTAWQTMSAMDVLLFAAALAAVAGGVLTVRSAEFAVVALLAGAAGIFFSLLGLVDLPDAGVSAVPGDTVAVERKIGVFVALVASVGIAYAGLRASRTRRSSAAGESRSPAAPPPSGRDRSRSRSPARSGR